jgi:DNA polymerase-3 subunit alpha
MARPKLTNADFVHLHNHTEYSAFDGLNKIKKFPKHAAEMGFKSLAITDHGNMGGAFKFMNECNSVGIKPIVGCEFYLAENRHIHFKTKKDKRGNLIEEGQTDGRKGNRHLVLIAKNWTGYQNLCRLSQASWTEGYAFQDPRIDFELLEKHHEGLICSSACLSSVVNANLLHNRYDQARKAAGMFQDLFGEDFFLEVMYHGIDAEAMIIPDVIKLSKDLGCTCIASNDCHYCEKCQGKSQELLMAMSTSRCLTDPKHISFPYHEFYLKSVDEMAVHFGSHPELLTNTSLVADKIDSNDIMENLTGKMRLPKYPIPEKFSTPYQYLEHLAFEGLKKLGWDTSKEHIDRLKMELRDVEVVWKNNRYDFATYFLVVRDYIIAAKERDILVGCGRGSGFGSVLLRCLDISYGPDPLQYGLLWERFLGFDDKFFISEQDFGLGDDEANLEQVVSTEEDREVEDDMGGVDRY